MWVKFIKHAKSYTPVPAVYYKASYGELLITTHTNRVRLLYYMSRKRTALFISTLRFKLIRFITPSLVGGGTNGEDTQADSQHARAHAV